MFFIARYFHFCLIPARYFYRSMDETCISHPKTCISMDSVFISLPTALYCIDN